MGVASEIHAYKNSQSDRIRWRTSIAGVCSDGPFSHFAGYDRIVDANMHHHPVQEGDLLLVQVPRQGKWSLSGAAVIVAQFSRIQADINGDIPDLMDWYANSGMPPSVENDWMV